MADDLPKKFREPTFEYDGTTDPHDHLVRFDNFAMLHQYTEGVKCRVFMTTLVRSAQRWFDQLRPNVINSFQDFALLFLHEFASARKPLKTTLSLFGIKQKDAESLKSYVDRFRLSALDVPTATSEILVNAFIQGLRNGDLFKSLAKKPAFDYDNLLSRAEKYINLEEAQHIRGERLESRGGRRVTRKGSQTFQINSPVKRRRLSFVPISGLHSPQIRLKSLWPLESVWISNGRQLAVKYQCVPGRISFVDFMTTIGTILTIVFI